MAGRPRLDSSQWPILVLIVWPNEHRQPLGQGAERVLRLVDGRRQRVHHGHHRRAGLPGICGLGRGVGVTVRLVPHPAGLGA